MDVTVRTLSPAVWNLELAAAPAAAGPLIDRAGLTALSDALARAAATPDCRVLTLTGPPGAFCLGLDVAEAIAAPPAEVLDQARAFARCLAALRASPCVVVAAVDGAVAGGGVGLVAAADLVLATARSSFGLPELVLGLLPAIVLPVLLERMPVGQARRLALSGSLTAPRALALGLCDEVVDDAAALEHGLRAAVKHALRCRPEAVAGLKRLAAELAGRTLPEALALGAEASAALLAAPDTQTTLRGYLMGDPLPWFDRLAPARRPQ